MPRRELLLHVLLLLLPAIASSFFFLDPHWWAWKRHLYYNSDPFGQAHRRQGVAGDGPEEYDFVVVGAGAAGAVLASRLSELAGWTVLLLEAGGYGSLVTAIPALAPTLQATDYNWGYTQEVTEGMCLGMEEQRCNWPKGKGVGGTSLINYMIYTRGHRTDYDRWEASGSPGWGWDSVLPYFKRSEDAHLAQMNESAHGRGGCMSVSDVHVRTLAAKEFIDGAKQLGYKEKDYNDGEPVGVSWIQSTTRQGQRESSYDSFLRPALHRSNLKISPHSRATKVLIDDNGRAYGVKFLRDRRWHEARARKEVILSAGVFASPQLMMLSGLGPKKHLEELGIRVLRDLPVGEGLQDHITFPGLVFKTNTSTSFPPNAFDLSGLKQWKLFRQGPLVSIGGVEAIAYARSPVPRPDLPPELPDVELLMVGGSLSSDNGDIYAKTYRIQPHIYERVFKPVKESSWTIFPMLLHPKSVGYMRLKADNIFKWPRFYGNGLADETDVKTLLEGIKMAISIASADTMKKYDTRLHDTPIPGCEQIAFNSDSYWECAIRHLATTLHHQVGTCRMGMDTDPQAVVNSDLKVKGVSRLRVADSSVIPFALGAHTYAPAVMIGEKAADMIKAEWMGVEAPTVP